MVMYLDPACFLNTLTPDTRFLYTCMTMFRLFDAEDNDRLVRAAQAFGATRWRFFPKEANTLSQTAIIGNGFDNIIFFQGTTNIGQLWRQIFFSNLSADPSAITGLAGSYWLWYVIRLLRTIGDALPNIKDRRQRVLLVGHSLGGAVAQIILNWAVKNWDWGPTAGCLTFGAPRAGDATFSTVGNTNTVRWTDTGDPVTEIPPSFSVSFELPIPGFAPLVVNMPYHHMGQAWMIDENGRYTRTNDTVANNLIPDAAVRAITQAEFSGDLFTPHFWPEYLRRLELTIAQPQFRDRFVADSITPLFRDINAERDLIDGVSGVPVIPPAPPAQQGLLTQWLFPNMTFPPDGSLPAIPVGQGGRRIEVRRLAYNLFHFARIQFVANSFRGHDRRLLETLQEVLLDIKKRDTLALTANKTRAVSTRQLMFPAGGDNDPAEALEVVVAQAAALLSQQAD